MRRYAIAIACAAPITLPVAESASRAEAEDAPATVDRPAAPPARWSVGFNPLAVAIGRFGADGEFLVAPHLALVANVHGDYASNALPAINYDRNAPIWGFGGEVGWRFYGRPDLYGIFLDVSLVSGWYDVDYYGARLTLPDIGFAVDLGGKASLGGDMFFTFGAGLQYLVTPSYPKDIAPGVSFVLGAGLDPRLIMTVGTLIH